MLMTLESRCSEILERWKIVIDFDEAQYKMTIACILATVGTN